MNKHAVCLTCKVDKPLDEFYGKSVYFKRKTCKVCVAAQQKKYKERKALSLNVLYHKPNKIRTGQYEYTTQQKRYKLIDGTVNKFCLRCHRFRDPVNFTSDVSRSDNLSVYCTDCTSIHNYKYRELRNNIIISEQESQELEEEINEELIAHNKVLDRIYREGYDNWYWNSMSEEIANGNVLCDD